jgi:GH25 family lysozyme M1 (1,4-beta-N-acetylmuramidase)
MKIKIPVVYDVSHWRPVQNYLAISPRPAMLIAKATEGATFKDDWFLRHMAGASQLGAVRGCYHFHRKAVSAALQVKNFCDFVRPVITKRDVLILDVEEGGETAAQLKAWFEGVMEQFPGNPYWIYSRKNLLDPIAMILGWFSSSAKERRIEQMNPLNAIQMTLAERTFFREKLQATWTAGYPANPDLYDSVPSFYVPDQTKWAPAKVWQYTEHGKVAGFDHEVDCNWMDADYFAGLGGDTAPPPANGDVETRPFTGVRRIVGRRYGSDFYLTIADRKTVEFRVAHSSNLKKPSAFAAQLQADMAWNGDAWDKYAPAPWKPLGFAVENGTIVTRREKNFVPSLDLPTAEMFHDDEKGTQVTSGFRYIVYGGTCPLDRTNPEYVTELHPRSAKGVDVNGNVMLLTVDGRSSVNRGMTLVETADLLMEFGCRHAFDSDSGGSSVDVMNGVVQNTPSDGMERAVVQTILLFAEKEIPMPYGEAKEKLNKSVAICTEPTIRRKTTASIAPGATIQWVEIVPDTDYPNDPNYAWFKMPDGRFVHYKYPRESAPPDRFIILSQPTPDVPPPPPSDSYDVIVTITNNGWYGEGVITVEPPK